MTAASNDLTRHEQLEQDTPDVLAWQREQDDLARTLLHDGPAFARFDALLRDAYVDVLTFHAPRPMRGRWFHRKTPPGATQPIVTLSPTPQGGGRVVFDLAELGLPHATLQDMQPAPDAKRVLLIVSPGDGTMNTRVLIVAADGDSTTPTHDFTIAGPVSVPVWWPDGRGFLYAGLPLGLDPATLPPAPGVRVFEQLLDEALTRAVVPLAHAHAIVLPQMSADGRYALISEDQGSVHPTYVRRRDGTWEPFLDASYGRVKGTIVGDEYVAITSHGAPRGRLMAIPLATARDLATWREILPESEAVLVSVTPAGGKLVVGETFQGNARLRVVWPNGTVEHTLPLPPHGAAGKFAFGFVTGLIDDLIWADGNDIAFIHSSLTRAPVAYRYDVRAGLLAEQRPEPGTATPSLKGMELQTLHTPTTSHSASVVYRVMRSAGAESPAPTIITGYGGFNVHWLACWNNMAAAWVRAGGVWVHAHLRGGGEFGESFWRDGRMALKGHGFDDLFSVMRDVVQRGLCQPRQLGLFGSSNGSLLVSAALAHRPDSFGAGVAQVPIVDVLGCAKDPATLNVVCSEYGDPRSERDTTWIRVWSPYEQLPTGHRFPALLVDAGAQDVMCPPWHARKLASVVRDKGTADSGPVLLRVREGAGHNVMNQALAIERDAETLAFFATQLGLAG